MTSASLKALPFNHEHINCLPFLDRAKIEQYASSVIEKRLAIMGKKYTRRYLTVIEKISTNRFCHGRPRLAASVLDNFF